MRASSAAGASAVTATTRGRGPAPRRRARQPGQDDRFVERQRARRARHEVEPDGVGTRGDRRQDAGRIGDPTDLHEWSARLRGRIGWIRAGRHERPGGGGRVGGAHEGLADERGVEAERPPVADRRRLAHAGFGDDEPIVRDEPAQASGPLEVHPERPQVAVVEADEAGAARHGALELALVVGLDERLQAEVAGEPDEAGQAPGRVEDRQEEHEVRPGGAQDGQLALVDDELLGQDRHADGRADRPQVLEGAAEPVRLAQDRDRDRAAGLVGPCPGDEVVALRGDRTGRRRGALDLGDEVQPGSGEAPGDVARSGRVHGPADELAVRGRSQLGGDVGGAAAGDLVDDRRCGGARRPAWRPARGPLDDGHAGAPSAAATAFSCSARSARSAASRRPGAPPSIVARARATPSASVAVRPATVSPAAALSRTTSRRGPGSPDSTPSTSRAFSSGVPPASSDGGHRCQPERHGIHADLADAGRVDLVDDARAVERQLVDAGAVDDERPLRPEPVEDRRDPGRGRGIGDPDHEPPDAGRVRERADEVERGPDADLATSRVRRGASPDGSPART